MALYRIENTSGGIVKLPHPLGRRLEKAETVSMSVPAGMTEANFNRRCPDRHTSDKHHCNRRRAAMTLSAMLGEISNRICADAPDMPSFLRESKFFRNDLKGAVLWRKLADELSINPATTLQHLGRGSRGDAFALPDGRVLKITQDHTEARAAAIVRDKPDPAGRIVRIDAVYGLQGKSQMGDLRFGYAIVQERLLPPDEDWGDAADKWNGGQYITPKTVEEFINTADDKLKSLKAAPEFFQWLQGVAAYLVARKIEFGDLWADNIMKRADGSHVLIDLGHSVSPGRLADMLDRSLARKLV